MKILALLKCQKLNVVYVGSAEKVNTQYLFKEYIGNDWQWSTDLVEKMGTAKFYIKIESFPDFLLG